MNVQTHFIETKYRRLSHDSVIWRLERSHKSKAHNFCYRHLPYFHSTLRNKPPPLALRTILLVQSQRPQETCQRRRLQWLKPCSQTDPGSTDANVGGTFFFFSCLFFFLKLQLVLLEKFVKLHQWRSETLVWKGTAGGRTPPGFQIPWNQWSEWHWYFYSR